MLAGAGGRPVLFNAHLELRHPIHSAVSYSLGAERPSIFLWLSLMASTDAGSPTSPPNSLRFRSESHDPTSPTKKYVSLSHNAYWLHSSMTTIYWLCFVIIPANYRVEMPPRKPKSLYGPRTGAPRKPIKNLKFGSASEERKSPAPGMSICSYL